MLKYGSRDTLTALTMHRIFPALAALLLSGTSCLADAPGIRAGINYWMYDINGTARYKTGNPDNNIDVDRDLGYNDGTAGVYYLLLEHPAPLLPSIRLQYTDIDEDANGRLKSTVMYGDTVFPANEAVNSRVKLKQTDITLYYELLDNGMSLDLGLDVKYIDSVARISGGISGTQEANVSGWVPLVYAGAGFELPLTGLEAGADGSFSRYQGSSFYDYVLHISYATPGHLGLDAGYRKIGVDLDDFDHSFADIEFEGPYAGVYLRF